MAGHYSSSFHSRDNLSMSSHEDIPITGEQDQGSSDAIPGDGLDELPHTGRGQCTFRYWCYGLHMVLILIHIVLLGMLFSHPEHQFSVPLNDTILTIGVKAFLQAFYTVYTTALVFMTRQLILSTVCTKQQKLTAMHDMFSAWNGIGAAISVLWQQTKVVSIPLPLLLTLTYLSCITGLHIISSSVIQFETFNNTVISVVPSTLAWPSPSVNLSGLDWGTISPLMALWPLLSTAKGLSGNTLYDIPSSGHAYTGATVNATTISAQCGLLSNLSIGTWDCPISYPPVPYYCVDIDGLGEVGLTVLALTNVVTYIPLLSPSSCPLCSNYIGFQVSTEVELGNLTSEALQVNANLTGETAAGTSVNVSSSSYYVACSLSATTATIYLTMQDGQAPYTLSSPSSTGSEPWAIWSPGSTSELVQMFNVAQATYTIFPVFCEELQSSNRVELCAGFTSANLYVDYLLGIPSISGSVIQGPSTSAIVLERSKMENAVAQTAAAILWLAGIVGSNGGFQQGQGTSQIADFNLELRPNISTIPVVIGLLASIMLLTTMAWMSYDPHPLYFKSSTPGLHFLGLMWISTHSTTIHNLMSNIRKLKPDQLRIEGMKAELYLDNLEFKSTRSDSSTQLGYNLKAYSVDVDWKISTTGGLQPSIFWWCYLLHGILLVLHGALILLLIYHPEHHLTISSDNPWATFSLSISLQAFYVLYTAGLVFLTQQLAMSAVIAKKHCLTVLHDIVQAWTSTGAAIYALQQQTRALSIWKILIVVIYVECVSILHIASSTIMQFTTFNSTSTHSVQSTVAWPTTTIIANSSWSSVVPIIPPNLFNNLQTTGLLNNTVYDTLNQTEPGFIDAVVNATSIQASCGLLSNLTYNSIDGIILGVDGLGTAVLSFQSNLGTYNDTKNQIFYSHIVNSCSSCNDYLFFVITTDVDLDESLIENATNSNLSVNIAQGASNSPVMAYAAACSLLFQTSPATLDLQAGTIDSNTTQPASQPWKLWSPVSGVSQDLVNDIDTVFYQTAFGICPQNEFEGCSAMTNASLLAQNSPLYTLYPNQLQWGIEQAVATIIWTAGQLGQNQGGFEWVTGESQVTQVVTKWMLNINTIPVMFAFASSLILFLLVFSLVGVPSRPARKHPSVTGLSVLETLWVATHSRMVHERMKKVNDPSLKNLRKAGMFEICLGDVDGPRFANPSENDSSDALLG